MEEKKVWEVALELRERLIRWVKASLGPDAKRRFDAESIVQSVLKSLCALSRKPRTEEELVSLLWVMTRYKLCKRLRREFAGCRDARLSVTLEGATQPDQPGWGPEEEAVWGELEERYDRWKQALPERERKVIELTEEDVPQERIALEVGVSSRQVRRYLKATEEQLRSFLGIPPDDPPRGSQNHE